LSIVMPLSNIVRKFAPRREQVVYNMVWVVHDAFEKCVINGFCQFCERVFLGNIGHYRCHGVRVLASVGDTKSL